MKKTKKNYSKIVYGIDIETSTVFELDGILYYFDGVNYAQIRNKKIKVPRNTVFDSEFSYMVSYCICCLDFTNGDYKKVSKGRTYEELDNELLRISETTENNIIIYAHNLSYENSFFINNLRFFENANLFALDSNKPVKVVCKNLEFRCSKVLLDKSIKTLGDEIGIPKLSFDYNTVRTTQTRLSKQEWEYNFRDVEIMLKSIYKLILNNQYIQSVSDIPLTKTGVSRLNCKSNIEINPLIKNTEKGKIKSRRLYELCCKNCFYGKARSPEQYIFWVNLFRGGFVYSNPSTVSKVINDVVSFDFSSDYPFQMLYREYPENFYEIKQTKNKIKYFNEVVNSTTPEKLITKRMGDRYINCKVIIRGLKAKYDFYPLGVTSIHSIFNEMKDGVVLNGKIKQCFKTVEIWLTHIDVMILTLFYDFQLINIPYLETTLQIKPSHQYRINCVTVLGNLKKEYKKYNKLVSSITEKTVFTEVEIPNKDVRNTLNKLDNPEEQIDYMNQIYLQCKGDLNSLYGDNAQHPIRDNVVYDSIDKEYKKEKGSWNKYETGNNSYTHKTSYIYGLYVPAYARASILYFAYMFIVNGVKPLYIDTDSVKITKEGYFKIRGIIDNYNLMIKSEITDKYGLDFGTLEYEGNYKKLVSLGSKCYLYLDNNNQIHATISGLPRANNLYNELLKKFNNNFDLMVSKCFHFNTILDYTTHNKLSANYKATYYNGCINKVSVSGYSGCVLKPVDLTLRGEKSKIWSHYRLLIKQLYGFDVETQKTIIRNEENTIIIDTL